LTGNKPAERADHIDSHEIATVDVDVAVPDSDGYLDDQDFEVGDGDIEITYEVDDPSRPSAARDIYVSELATAAKHEEARRQSDVQLDPERMKAAINEALGRISRMPKMLYAAKQIQEAVERLADERLASSGSKHAESDYDG
jgi:hypothetical protein